MWDQRDPRLQVVSPRKHHAGPVRLPARWDLCQQRLLPFAEFARPDAPHERTEGADLAQPFCIELATQRHGKEDDDAFGTLGGTRLKTIEMIQIGGLDMAGSGQGFHQVRRK